MSLWLFYIQNIFLIISPKLLVNFFSDIIRSIFSQAQFPVSTDENDWAKDDEGNTTSTVEV